MVLVRIDEKLVWRLEASAAQAGLDLARGIKAADPTGPCQAVKFAEGALISTGPNSYLNRALGLTRAGLSMTQLDEIEQFYVAKQMAPTIELSSWAPDSTVSELASRGYQPCWFRAMYALAVNDYRSAPVNEVRVELSDREDGIWPESIALAYGITDASSRAASNEMASAGRRVSSSIFYAKLDGEIAGCASVQVVDGIAWLGPAVTLEKFRRRGVQAALVTARLGVAKDLGCDLAAATAHPNGASARNILSLGFEHIQTQVVMSLSLSN